MPFFATISLVTDIYSVTRTRCHRINANGHLCPLQERGATELTLTDIYVRVCVIRSQNRGMFTFWGTFGHAKEVSPSRKIDF
ncbi:hypothetical protein GCM10010913_02180 [Paenibacillus aceti]|uniref:Secreted protein n=1 Tax=Paenibacillus aceti TaxID=1820010 RepID=A0ABQ1VQI5_9BACL|nr:hypothetical protein GCM10010913_02180 [Paenibacillus aceti]